MTHIDWQPDVLTGFDNHQWRLGASTVEGEPDVALTATLVRAQPQRSKVAVLYVHGWNDYFFQTHLAEFFQSVGYDFYALDLRRYGRNLQPGLYAGYVTDMAEYGEEISYALDVIKADHDSVVLMGHSTGGLTVSLWAGRNPGAISGLILNAPWLDMHGSFPWAAAQSVLTPIIKVTPTKAVTKTGLQLTRMATHVSGHGEWEYNTDWKGTPAFIGRYGWMNAILNAQAEVAKGLSIDVPILALMSSRSVLSPTWSDDLMEVDFVLDVDKLAAAATRLGNHLSLVRFPGAMHDVFLSKQPVRDRVFADMEKWLATYLAG